MFDRLRSWVRGETLDYRAIDSFTDHPGLTEQLLAAQGLRASTFTPPSVRQVLGIPAVFRSVTLIANLVGMLALVAYRNGSRLAPELTPRLVQRPDPYRVPRDFWRDTAYNLASRGEYLHYIGQRDGDGGVLSLINVPPAEVQVEWEDELRGLRSYRWRDVPVPRERWVHGTFVQEPGSPRGVGPLQLCGAALSIAVEADEWAASYYAGGGIPSVVLRHPDELTDGEAEDLRTGWMARAPRTPRVVSGGVEVEPVQINAAEAQMVEARLANVGEVARMFGLPGKLLEYAQSGTSLTYQNLADLGDDLVRYTLAPGYLEPIEQQMSDLLTRSTVCRFNVDGLLRSSLQQRYDAYRTALGPNVPWITVPEVREVEGLDAGGVEYAPVPPAQPSAAPVLPSRLEAQVQSGVIQ